MPSHEQNSDSPVGIALGYGLDDRRVRVPAGAGNFSLHYRVQNGSGAHPASYPLGTRGSFHGVKRPGREADHSPPSSTEVKEWVELYLHFPNTTSWRGAQSIGTTLLLSYHTPTFSPSTVGAASSNNQRRSPSFNNNGSAIELSKQYWGGNLFRFWTSGQRVMTSFYEVPL
jgi:hypothetical protein